MTFNLAWLLASIPKDLRRLPPPRLSEFTMDTLLISELGRVLSRLKPKRILELGPGLSTFALAAYAPWAQIVSIEHHAEHFRYWRAGAADGEASPHIARFMNGRLTVLHRPLHIGESPDRSWYDLAGDEFSDVDFVLVDGPPAYEGPNARKPAPLHLRPMLAPESHWFVDDMNRPEELAAVASWIGGLEPALKFERANVFHFEGLTGRKATLLRSQKVFSEVQS